MERTGESTPKTSSKSAIFEAPTASTLMPTVSSVESAEMRRELPVEASKSAAKPAGSEVRNGTR